MGDWGGGERTWRDARGNVKRPRGALGAAAKCEGRGVEIACTDLVQHPRRLRQALGVVIGSAKVLDAKRGGVDAEGRVHAERTRRACAALVLLAQRK